MGLTSNLIKQYASTGAIIPYSQLKQLNNNLLRTYFRRRILQAEEADSYYIRGMEYKVMPDDIFIKYIQTGPLLESEVFNTLTPEQIKIYINGKLDRIEKYNASGWPGGANRRMLQYEMMYMNDAQLKRYEDMGEHVPDFIKSEREIVNSPKEFQIKTMIDYLKDGSPPSWIWPLFKDEEMFKEILPHINEFVHPSAIPLNNYKLYSIQRINDGYKLFQVDLRKLAQSSDEDLQYVLKHLIDVNISDINDTILDAMSKDTLNYYIKKINNE
jgi:hypothetical protein